MSSNLRRQLSWPLDMSSNVKVKAPNETQAEKGSDLGKEEHDSSDESLEERNTATAGGSEKRDFGTFCHSFSLKRKSKVKNEYSFRLPQYLQYLRSSQSSIKAEESSDVLFDIPTSEELILEDEIIQELLEMRLFFNHLAGNRPSSSLYNLLVLRPSDTPKTLETTHETPSDTNEEPIPHFPVGNWEFEECNVCWEKVWLYRRPCCAFAVCTNCSTTYYDYKVKIGIVSIECVNPKCHEYVHRDEISVRLKSETKSIYYRLLSAGNCDETSKTCPQCNCVHRLPSDTDLKLMRKKAKNNFSVSRVNCAECDCIWCFLCHSPWHAGVSCNQFRKGDRLLKMWAKQITHGQVNAQRCPKCKTYIQRSSGCDHMHCTRCETNFCYRCGDQLRRLKFFGDHYSKLSIFGCKYRYKAEKPIQRKLIRGAVFGSKVLLAPILGSLVACAGLLVCGVAVGALPLYGGIRLYRVIQRSNTSTKNNCTQQRQFVLNVNGEDLFSEA